MILADAALSSPLVSTNIQVVLAFVVIVSWGIIGVLWKENRQLYKDKDNTQEKRLQDKVDTIDKYNEAMGESSRTNELLIAKLKSGN